MKKKKLLKKIDLLELQLNESDMVQEMMLESIKVLELELTIIKQNIS